MGYLVERRPYSNDPCKGMMAGGEQSTRRNTSRNQGSPQRAHYDNHKRQECLEAMFSQILNVSMKNQLSCVPKSRAVVLILVFKYFCF